MKSRNTNRRTLQFAVLALVASFPNLSGCGRGVIEAPDELVLYSIDGRDDKKSAEGTELFHTYPVLGKIDVKNADQRQKIMQAVKNGMARSDGTRAACFWPRHGIHAISGARAVDYVICFECMQLAIHEGNKPKYVATTREPQEFLDSVLMESGVPLAP